MVVAILLLGFTKNVSFKSGRVGGPQSLERHD